MIEKLPKYETKISAHSVRISPSIPEIVDKINELIDAHNSHTHEISKIVDQDERSVTTSTEVTSPPRSERGEQE